MLSMPRIHAATLARTASLVLFAVAPVVALAQTTTELSALVAFSGSTVASNAVQGPDGALYGTTSAVSIVTGGLVYRAAADGSSVRTIYQLTLNDGLSPVAGLLLGSDNLLYGTTSSGAASQAGSTGTVFRLSTDGSGFSVIHRFEPYSFVNVIGSPLNADGASPVAELIEGPDGFLYGVTRDGGPNGTGVVFKLARDGSDFAVLHAFAEVTSDADTSPAINADGLNLFGTLVAGPDGFLYGTASSGGSNGNGTVFRIGFDGSGFEVVYTFSALTANANGLSLNDDGATPIAGLTDGGDGLLYGVTNLGGSGGNGTIFSFDPASRLLTTLHAFDGTAGARPTGELLLAADGRLYGSTGTGGTNAQGNTTTFGTLFSIARDGTGFTSLLSFEGNNGSSPTGRMLQLDESTFVGVATGGGRCGQGVLYNLSLTGEVVKGVTNCGQKKNSGGGSVGPMLLLLLGSLGLVRRRRDH
jgi:MYXO-CTERM domain-containing protein